MTLPTTQPFDYPDWGTPATYTWDSYVELNVVALPSLIAAVETSRYTYAVVYLTADGDGTTQLFQFKWMTNSTSEGGSVVAQTQVVWSTGYAVIVPMLAWAPWLEIWLADASATPADVRLSVTLTSGFPQNVGYPGGPTVLTYNDTAGAMATIPLIPLGCAPTRHQIWFVTDATLWDLNLIVFDEFLMERTYLLADETTVGGRRIEFIPPDSAWRLDFVNGDATDSDIDITIVRLP